MRLIIDAQGAQSKSRLRGIGRYSRSLITALIRSKGQHEVVLALNGLLPQVVEGIRAEFARDLPGERILVWTAPSGVNGLNASNDDRRRAAEWIRECLFCSLRPDFVLVTSLFEGAEDDALTSIGSWSTRVRTACVLYDLIPLAHRDAYLAPNPALERWYLNKLDHLRRADLLLAISEASRHEAIELLAFDARQIVNVSTACDEVFAPNVLGRAERHRLEGKFGIERPVVLYTGGGDARKNVARLVEAFARLPAIVRGSHQLLVASSSMYPHQLDEFRALGRERGLEAHDFLIPGHVSDEDLVGLYNLAKLFVFPSWHEGFGLPALEAMACGRAVIGSNVSAIPEVIGRADALFDPFDIGEMAALIERALTDDAWRGELERHALRQSAHFSWNETAARTWQALSRQLHEANASLPTNLARVRRPRLAYFSPLPPERSGIAGYSAELLPELARHYEIEVIVAQPDVADAWIRANCRVREPAWFRAHADRYDRILYHIGNSHFHGYMLEMLHEHPGVIVLHDFFLSSALYHVDMRDHAMPNAWTDALFLAHGYRAILNRYTAPDPMDVVLTYPCNLEVLQAALGIIVHSEYSRQLAREWYGDGAAADWKQIPLLRQPCRGIDRQRARRALGLADSDFVVCSFGMVGPTKLNDRVLKAFIDSPLAADERCRLVFVGENHEGHYGKSLLETASSSPCAPRIAITGWADARTFETWLTAADVGVQLRCLSRGETSAAVLDCLNYGLATIVNAHGAMAELDEHAVWKLPDKFDDEQLVKALTTLYTDSERRTAQGRRAKEFIGVVHNPKSCAARYVECIESYYDESADRNSSLVERIGAERGGLDTNSLRQLAAALAENFPPLARQRQLLLDVSELAHRDAHTGIERVARSVLRELLVNPPAGFRVEPICAGDRTPGYFYARRFASRFLNVPEDWARDEPVAAMAGDLFIGLELHTHVVLRQRSVLAQWHLKGVGVHFVVYDLLPVLRPDVFPPGMDRVHHAWLQLITSFDGAICISKSVADELRAWLDVFGAERNRPFAIKWFHLGGDLDGSVPTRGLPSDAAVFLARLAARPTFLMVGTVEPRKGHEQTVDAFTILWQRGLDVNLVIVGREGWKSVPEDQRRTIPVVLEKLRSHPMRSERLFWMEDVSDEFLSGIYDASTCLIAGSEGEGFGLPIIEAARYGLPVIARNIPVFREVAGDHAFYFADDRDPKALADAVVQWLDLKRLGTQPRSDLIPSISWSDSARQLVRAVEERNDAEGWLPDGVRRFWGGDPRLLSEIGERRGTSIATTKRSGFLTYGPYIELPPGEYALIAEGTARHWSGAERLEVVHQRATAELLREPLSQPTAGPWRFETRFCLQSPASSLEIRIWVDAASVLSVNGLELILRDDQDPSESPLTSADASSHQTPVIAFARQEYPVTGELGSAPPG